MAAVLFRSPPRRKRRVENFFTTITSDQYIPSLLSQYGGIQGLSAIGAGSVGVVDTSATVNADTTVSGHRAYSSGNLTRLFKPKSTTATPPPPTA